ncbi:hypothetical protein CFC21_050865 [Triticum aestivum]|uniref:Protein TIFY n=3 Tax=Triticum TaxID=4564 RepID=A0A9R0S2A2_TRITD|nr:protein TIFY 11a-like [Triticum dicoccoides]XP_044362134.1 protein TIFY 11a-like [Triticum aestivum]KAF7041024.1 hypothetical protein CFC21_050865 [Triticum aestivum]VAH86977.1 unnamed protein product [Triticum turgidum subsp. durum]
MPPMATTTATAAAADSAARRFASACGVLSQYVRASGVSAPGVLGAALQEPGSPADGAQELTIFYGGRVVVLDGCTPARAAELIRFAAAAAAASQGAPVAQPPAPAFVDMPIARKASLQRFLSKRKDRSAGAAPAPAPEGPPYAHHEEEPAPPKKKGKTEASSWLALGSLGDMHAP